MRRTLFGLITSTLALVLIGPWLLYELALSNVVGRPALPATAVVPSRTSHVLPAGTHLAWFVARHHNADHLKDRRMIWWHMSGAALTIWLTCHWSTDQLTAKAHQILRSAQTAPTP